MGYLPHSGRPYILWSAPSVLAKHFTIDLYGAGPTATAMHLVNVDRRRWSCSNVDDGSVHFHHIELRMNAHTPNDAVQGLLHRGRPDVWSHLLHVDTDECLAGPAHRLRNFVIAEYD